MIGDAQRVTLGLVLCVAALRQAAAEPGHGTRGRRQAAGGQDFADLFARDAQFVIDQGPANVRVLSTRAQLINLAGGPDCQMARIPPRSDVLHTEANLIIDPAPGGG